MDEIDRLILKVRGRLLRWDNVGVRYGYGKMQLIFPCSDPNCDESFAYVRAYMIHRVEHLRWEKCGPPGERRARR